MPPMFTPAHLCVNAMSETQSLRVRLLVVVICDFILLAVTYCERHIGIEVGMYFLNVSNDQPDTTQII